MFITIILFNAKVGIFSQSYTVILSLIHLLFQYYLLLGSLLQFFSCELTAIYDCSIRLAAVSDYIKPIKGCGYKVCLSELVVKEAWFQLEVWSSCSKS